MAVWAFAVRPERQRFTLLQKAPCGFALIAQQEWEEKAPSEMKDEERCKKKKESTSQILRFKQICVVPDARVFLAGCTGTPFL